MQFSALLLAAAAAAVNAVQLTNTVYNDITAGKPYVVNWSGASGPVTLTLKDGGANNLNTVSTITSGATGTSFTWDVPATLPKDTYAIEISDSSATNYSPQFELLGATATASASGSTSASSASASSTASASSAASSSASLTTTVSASTASSSASSTANSTSSSNSTSSASKTTASNSASRTGTSPAGASSSVPNTNSAAEYASPLALVFLTFAAIMTLN